LKDPLKVKEPGGIGASAAPYKLNVMLPGICDLSRRRESWVEDHQECA